VARSKSTSKLQRKLYLDSGATNHMSNEMSDFVDLRHTNRYIGTGKKRKDVQALGIEHMEIISPLAMVTLKLAWYAPDISEILISVRQLTQTGMVVLFQDKGVRIFNSAQSMIELMNGVIDEESGLYKLNVACQEKASQSQDQQPDGQNLHLKSIPADDLSENELRQKVGM
jgi:hypothetical protein